MTALPAISAAAMPPQGMAQGKFHGEETHRTPSGVKEAPSSMPGRVRPSA